MQASFELTETRVFRSRKWQLTIAAERLQFQDLRDATFELVAAREADERIELQAVPHLPKQLHLFANNKTRSFQLSNEAAAAVELWLEQSKGEDRSALYISQHGNPPRRWRMALTPGLARLQRLDGSEAHELTREEATRRLELLDSFLLRRMMAIKLGRKRRLFRLDPEAQSAVRAWLGPPTLQDLEVALKKRLGWTMPIGFLVAVSSLPLPGDPAAGIPEMPFSAFNFFLGVSLVGLGLVSRIKPNRWFFVLDSVWLIALAAKTLLDVTMGASYFWLLFLPFEIGAAIGGLKRFRRFPPRKETARGKRHR